MDLLQYKAKTNFKELHLVHLFTKILVFKIKNINEDFVSIRYIPQGQNWSKQSLEHHLY